MIDLIAVTTERVHGIVQKQGSVSLSHLETTLNTSFNLLFLAIDRLVIDGKISIRKGEWDYIISSQS